MFFVFLLELCWFVDWIVVLSHFQWQSPWILYLLPGNSKTSSRFSIPFNRIALQELVYQSEDCMVKCRKADIDYGLCLSLVIGEPSVQTAMCILMLQCCCCLLISSAEKSPASIDFTVALTQCRVAPFAVIRTAAYLCSQISVETV